MNLIPWRNKQREDLVPESPLVTLRTEMDRLFDSFIREPFGAWDWPGFLGGQQGWPAVDVSESEKEILVRAELPGVDPKELDVSVTGNQLILSGEKKEEKETKEQGYYHSEARYGTFRRVIPLPEGADSEKVDAQYAHGVLTLKIAKAPSAAAKRIEIKGV
ncbi:MAG: Hsp20/alpha crystallin family protein [Pirellulales bacterium]|nr:Hsp20/alpha crystallin family protein [Pirellulales bacterium]